MSLHDVWTSTIARLQLERNDALKFKTEEGIRDAEADLMKMSYNKFIEIRKTVDAYGNYDDENLIIAIRSILRSDDCQPRRSNIIIRKINEGVGLEGEYEVVQVDYANNDPFANFSEKNRKTYLSGYSKQFFYFYEAILNDESIGIK